MSVASTVNMQSSFSGANKGEFGRGAGGRAGQYFRGCASVYLCVCVTLGQCGLQGVDEGELRNKPEKYSMDSMPHIV